MFNQEQLQEIKSLGIKEIALFPTTLLPNERKELYSQLETSGVIEVKLLHLRSDFSQEELEYFFNKYKTRYFNCHPSDLDNFYQKFAQYRKYILLELNYKYNLFPLPIEPKQMGGFCIDLAHFKTAQVRKTPDYDYVTERKHNTKFLANHLGGYSKSKIHDLHFVTNENQFDYLLDLPEYIFGEVIALELENSIRKQLKFKEYVVRLLANKDI